MTIILNIAIPACVWGLFLLADRILWPKPRTRRSSMGGRWQRGPR